MLAWSTSRNPNNECRYNHAVAETPLGELRIEWKGWKDYPSFDATMPWGEYITGTDLDDIKSSVQLSWDRISIDVSALATPK